MTISRARTGSPKDTFEIPSTVGQAGRASLISRRPSMVSTAPPMYAASPLAAGKTSGSKTMSVSGTPYFEVRSAWPRRAISSLRSRVKACACFGSSSMTPKITAAP